MLPAYLLSLREGLEAALIIGILLGALRKLGRSNSNKVIWSGVLSAALLSLILALALNWFGKSFEGRTEEVFEGSAMFLAATVLTWVLFWMQRQGKYIKDALEANVQRAALQGGSWALFLVAFSAVLREGVELGLFLTAAAIATDAPQVVSGAALGLGTATLLGWSLFASLVKLDLRRFFQITSFLLLLFAAGLVAHGVHEFNEVGWIPTLIEHVWDTNILLDENSILGQMLKALFGYNGNPSLSEVLGYLLYLGGVIWGLRWKTVSATAPQST